MLLGCVKINYFDCPCLRNVPTLNVSTGSAPPHATTLANLKIKPELVVLEYLKPL